MRKTAFFLTLLSLLTMISCNNRKHAPGENPLLEKWDTPFGVPPFDKIETSDYLPAFDSAMRMHNAEIDSIVNNPAAPTFDNVIAALDRSGEMLTSIYNVFSLVCAADADDAMLKVQEQIAPVMAGHNDGIYLNDGLFQKVKTLYEERQALGLDSLQMRLLEKTYKRFERAGANLAPQQKEQLKKINSEMAAAAVRFGNNLLVDNKNFLLVLDTADIKSLPGNIRAAAAEKASAEGHDGKYAFTLSKPSLLPFLTYSDRRDLREKLYKGYLERGNHGDSTDNKQLVNDLVRLRTERARLLGYDSHAAYVLDAQMAKTPENVYSLLDALWEPALRSAQAELDSMRAIKLKETGDADFQSWDWWYYAEKVRKAQYNLDEEMLRPYFSLENVRAGIFDLSNRLYGLTFRPLNIPLYNPECMAYEVLDMDNSHLGVLILDFFPRDGKGAGAWCGAFRERTYKNGERIDPVINIVCNFTRPTETQPALLNLDETKTFFHEFGHALHSLFTDVPYNGLLNVERDLVELPSQIMENWAVEPAMLRRYASHYSSGAVIPEVLIQKIQQSALFNQGFATTEYLAASLSDMDIHSLSEYTPINVNAFEHEALFEKRGLMPQIEPRYRYPYFAHIFGGDFDYSAGYYSYIWAEVLDKDAYQAFVESGDIFNRELATRLRRELLSRGGSADGMTLYTNFRGKEPSRDPLLFSRGFIKELPKPEPADSTAARPTPEVTSEAK